MRFVPRKPIRLSDREYLGCGVYFVTVCCTNRLPVFKNTERGLVAIAALNHVATCLDFRVHAYCVMPEHAHILVEGITALSDVMHFIGQWKQRTAYLLRDEIPRGFWQQRFYDHVLRRASDYESVAWYIWTNPVRKGLVATPEQYPLSGSFTVSWPKTCPPSHPWLPPWKSAAGRAEATTLQTSSGTPLTDKPCAGV